MRATWVFASLAAMMLGGSARAQGFGYYMPSEYPGYGIYAPGTSRALSYGVGTAPPYGWYPPMNTRTGPAPAAAGASPNRTTGGIGFGVGPGLGGQGFYFRGWRR